MLVIFRSQAAGDVMMFGDVATRMIALMGKNPAGQGIITADQLPAAIARLRAAAADDQASQAGLRAADLPAFEEAPDGSRRDYVSFNRRAMPLIELLERSLEQQMPVIWGV